MIDQDNDTYVTHFVYPYIIPDDPRFGWELLYSIRSIYKNFKDPFDITIIGEIPKWIDSTKVICINHDNRASYPGVQARVFSATMIAANIYSDMMTINDDMYLIKPTNFVELSKVRYLQKGLKFTESDLDKTNSQFQKNIMHGCIELKKRNKDDSYNFATHTPELFHSNKLKELHKEFNLINEITKDNFVTENIYYPYFNIPSEELGTFRVGVWIDGVDGDYTKATILCHDEDGFLMNPWIIKYLSTEFSEKCPAEK